MEEQRVFQTCVRMAPRALALSAVLSAALMAGVAHAQTPSPREVLAGMEAAWARTDAYTCRMNVWTKRGSEEKVQAFDYTFKKPRLIRLKVLADPHRGADVVYRDGKIRAAQRIFGIRVKKGMSPKDPDLSSLRGVPFWEADMGSQVSLIRALLPSAAASTEPVRENGANLIALTLRWRGEDPHLHQGVHTYVMSWRVDPSTYFPASRATTEDGVRVEDVRASNLQRNPSVPDDVFNL